MDQERRRDDERTETPEGVRIIGAEEAAEALERGDVAHRRSADELRFGDRPPSPPADGPRPVLRFPLGSSDDPTDVDRPPVAPAEPAEPSGPVELPHWTEPPSGQVPSVVASASTDEPEERDDLDDWAAIAQSPRWRDDTSGDHGDEDVSIFGDDSTRLGALDESERISHDDYLSFADLDDHVAPGRSVFADVDAGETDDSDEPEVASWDPSFELDESEAEWDEAPEDAAVDDTSQVPRDERPEPAGRVPVDEPPAERPRPGPRRRPAAHVGGDEPPSERDLTTAVIVGVGLLAAALLLFNIGPAAAMILVTAVVTLSVAELYGALRLAGYQPVALAGIAGTAGLVLGAYNYGPGAIPSVLFLTTVVCLLWYLVGAATESPMMNIGVTLAGLLWVGMFGSFAALMLNLQDPGIGILLAAILGTVAYDVGGLFVGRNAGRQPLSAVSPNKTVEGLVGGCVVGFVVVVVGAVAVGFGPIDTFAEGALVGLMVAIAAPLGDLVESLVKRDLGVKDMGALLPGHGGLMDRFDSLLFVLPAVYLLASVRDFFA